MKKALAWFRLDAYDRWEHPSRGWPIFKEGISSLRGGSSEIQLKGPFFFWDPKVGPLLARDLRKYGPRNVVSILLDFSHLHEDLLEEVVLAVESLRKLQSLTLKGSVVCHLDKVRLPDTLTTLILHGGSPTHCLFPPLVQKLNVTRLDLTHSHSIDPAGLATMLSTFPALKALNLSMNSMGVFSVGDAVSAKVLPIIARLSGLEKLDLSGNFWNLVALDLISTALGSLTNLREIAILGSNGEASVESVVNPLLPGLEHLKLLVRCFDFEVQDEIAWKFYQGRALRLNVARSLAKLPCLEIRRFDKDLKDAIIEERERLLLVAATFKTEVQVEPESTLAGDLAGNQRNLGTRLPEKSDVSDALSDSLLDGHRSEERLGEASEGKPSSDEPSAGLSSESAGLVEAPLEAKDRFVGAVRLDCEDKPSAASDAAGMQLVDESSESGTSVDDLVGSAKIDKLAEDEPHAFELGEVDEDSDVDDIGQESGDDESLGELQLVSSAVTVDQALLSRMHQCFETLEGQARLLLSAPDEMSKRLFQKRLFEETLRGAAGEHVKASPAASFYFTEMHLLLGSLFTGAQAISSGSVVAVGSTFVSVLASVAEHAVSPLPLVGPLLGSILKQGAAAFQQLQARSAAEKVCRVAPGGLAQRVAGAVALHLALARGPSLQAICAGRTSNDLSVLQAVRQRWDLLMKLPQKEARIKALVKDDVGRLLESVLAERVKGLPMDTDGMEVSRQLIAAALSLQTSPAVSVQVSAQTPSPLVRLAVQAPTAIVVGASQQTEALEKLVKEQEAMIRRLQADHADTGDLVRQLKAEVQQLKGHVTAGDRGAFQGGSMLQISARAGVDGEAVLEARLSHLEGHVDVVQAAVVHLQAESQGRSLNDRRKQEIETLL